MSDFLVDLGTRRGIRKAVKSLGLPIPLPQKLERSGAPWEERPLEGRQAVVRHTAGSEFMDLIARTLAAAGAETGVIAAKVQEKPYREHGGAWGRPPSVLKDEEGADGPRANYLLFDASGLTGPGDLKQMYTFFQRRIRGLAACGRAIVLVRPPAHAPSPAAAACAQAIDGFVRSLAREIGRKGATAQSLYIESGAETHAEPVLRFLLSNRSAYISAQPVFVTASVPLEGGPPIRRPLDGKIALVTGAARGIGAAIAVSLAREGAHVMGVDRPSEDGPLSKHMDDLGGTMILCDITDDDAPAVVRKAIEKSFGGFDIVVHNAGVTRDKMLANMDEQKWDVTLGVNLVSLIALNEGLKPMIRKQGSVICMSSIGGIAGNMGQTNYAASKAGVIGYVRATAPTLAGRNITVNAIAPGFIETRMTAAIPFATREVARRLCDLSQGGLPEDIAELTTFLASPGGAGINGQVLRICGGNYVGA